MEDMNRLLNERLSSELLDDQEFVAGEEDVTQTHRPGF